MKIKWSIALASLFFIFLISNANASLLGPNSLDHGYYVTSNYNNEYAPPSATVTITAETTDTRIKAVRFLWFAPDGTLARISNRIPIEEDGSEWTNNTGTYIIHSAQDSYEPNISGHWGVVAIYSDEFETAICSFPIIVAIRFTLFNVVPEIQILGTAGSAGIMALGIGLFITKRRKLGNPV